MSLLTKITLSILCATLVTVVWLHSVRLDTGSWYLGLLSQRVDLLSHRVDALTQELQIAEHSSQTQLEILQKHLDLVQTHEDFLHARLERQQAIQQDLLTQLNTCALPHMLQP